ncbi:hypothetical protein niasHT_011530 [Heterodera trifolii]|uniref:Uncharacterized protein n=1 Tax=Heterodera trifolii TaxID=157864 RepID=A0ABD2LHC6_9BILA
MKTRIGDCCVKGYAWVCCKKPASELKGCQKTQSECPKNCTWAACHPQEGNCGDECCKAGYGHKKKVRPWLRRMLPGQWNKVPNVTLQTMSFCGPRKLNCVIARCKDTRTV